MRERPIIFSAPMIRALLDGRKTQTRRLVRTREPLSFLGGRGEEDDPACWGWSFDGRDHHGYTVLARGLNERHDHGRISIPCPYGEIGDRLWVRETWRIGGDENLDVVIGTVGLDRRPRNDRGLWAAYRATDPDVEYDEPHPWRPSIFMPRWASRLTLEHAVDVRVQRLQALSEEDARAEAVEPFFTRFPEIGRNQRISSGDLARDAERRASFAVTWDEINGDRALWARSGAALRQPRHRVAVSQRPSDVRDVQRRGSGRLATMRGVFSHGERKPEMTEYRTVDGVPVKLGDRVWRWMGWGAPRLRRLDKTDLGMWWLHMISKQIYSTERAALDAAIADRRRDLAKARGQVRGAAGSLKRLTDRRRRLDR